MPISNINIHSEFISEEDTKEDISRFVRSFTPLLPCPGSEKWPDKSAMAPQIVTKSGGSFLSASLICLELREAATEREIDEVLGSVPFDMDSLYSHILDDMSNTRMGKGGNKVLHGLGNVRVPALGHHGDPRACRDRTRRKVERQD